MGKLDPTDAGWHFAFKRPSTGDRYMITVGVLDRDVALIVAVSASLHFDEDELIGESPVSAALMERYGVPPGGWQQTV